MDLHSLFPPPVDFGCRLHRLPVPGPDTSARPSEEQLGFYPFSVEIVEKVNNEFQKSLWAGD